MQDRSKEPEIQVFKLLKPILGPVIDQIWRRYQGMQPERRARVLRRLNVLAAHLLDMRVGGEEKIYLEPPPATLIGGGDYQLGSVSYPKVAAAPFRIYKAELLQHLFVLGRSGTGKTTFFLNTLEQLLRDNVPFWILDWKRNYRTLLTHEHGSQMIVLTVGSDLAPLRMNILQPPAGVDRNEWIEALTDTIGTGYLLMVGAKNVLKDGMLDAIKRLGTNATLRDALPYIKEEFTRAKMRKSGWLESTERAIDELTKGPFGEALNARTGGTTIEALLPQHVTFELEGLGDDQRKTFSVFLLQAVLLTRKKQTLPREVLHQVLLFDEAHNVFTKEKQGDPPNVQSRPAREIREFGVGLMAGTQQTDISTSIMANSGTTIALQTRWPWDTKVASELLGVEQKHLSELPKGHGIARLPHRHGKAFLFSFPEQRIKNVIVPDAAIRARYDAWGGNRAIAAIPIPEPAPGAREVQLLLDIANHPISTVTQRYTRLGWSPRLGNTIQHRILDDGSAEFISIDAGNGPIGKLKVLILKEKGEGIVLQHGGTLKSTGAAGIVHELWRSRLRDRCEQHGYTVTEEYHLGSGKRVDLHATKNGRTIRIEVETGKSEVHANIRKNNGQPLVVFFTNQTAYAAARPHIPADVMVLTPETINNIHRILRET